MKPAVALFVLLLSLLLLSRSSAQAATDEELARDAVSRFAQIGSRRCTDLRHRIEFAEATSSTDGEHTEANFTLKLGDQTYKVRVVDGEVESVSRAAATGP